MRAHPPPPEDAFIPPGSGGYELRQVNPWIKKRVGHMNPPRCVIFANGTLPDIAAAGRILRPDDWIVCADGGVRHALALGLMPNIVVGDLDSIDAADLARVREAGIEIRAYPTDKDETDLELALTYALERGPEAITIVAALGARLDHTLGNLSLLLDPRLARRDCCFDDGIERVLLCRSQVDLQGQPGDTVSLVPWGAPVVRVSTRGLKWALKDETLFPDRSRGISNQMLENSAQVTIGSGLLLIIHRRASLAAASSIGG